MRRKLYPSTPGFLKNLHFQNFSLCISNSYSLRGWKLISTTYWLLYTFWEILSDIFLMHHTEKFCVSCLIKMGPQKNSVLFQILGSSNICFLCLMSSGFASDAMIILGSNFDSLAFHSSIPQTVLVCFIFLKNVFAHRHIFLKERILIRLL